jgi:hypothetical protein
MEIEWLEVSDEERQQARAIVAMVEQVLATMPPVHTVVDMADVQPGADVVVPRTGPPRDLTDEVDRGQRGVEQGDAPVPVQLDVPAPAGLEAIPQEAHEPGLCLADATWAQARQAGASRRPARRPRRGRRPGSGCHPRLVPARACRPPPPWRRSPARSNGRRPRAHPIARSRPHERAALDVREQEGHGPRWRPANHAAIVPSGPADRHTARPGGHRDGCPGLAVGSRAHLGDDVGPLGVAP